TKTGQEQQCRIQVLFPIALEVDAPLTVVTVGFYVFSQRFFFLFPRADWSFITQLRCYGDATIERRPTHGLGKNEVTWAITHLPKSMIRFTASLAHVVQELHQKLPVVGFDGFSLSVANPGELHQFGKDVQL